LYTRVNYLLLLLCMETHDFQDTPLLNLHIGSVQYKTGICNEIFIIFIII